ncbi:MAG TPA: hypothetical protein ENK60_04350 [Anaerolineae bacterium]|nr:hypothetical protein [Anaerolineae bacterium]
MKQHAEQIVWSLVLVLLLAFVLVQLLGLVLLWPLLPEDWAFLAGLLVFWLLANRLLFGYGQFIQTAERFLADVAIDVEGIRAKVHHPAEWLESLALGSLLTAWLHDLDKYRYTFYTAYLIVALFTMLTKFNLLGYNLVGNYLEGAFWGASVVGFLVLALDLTAHTYPADILAHAREVLTSTEQEIAVEPV